VVAPVVVIGLTLGAVLAAASARAPATKPDDPVRDSATREMRLVMGTTAEIAVDGLDDPAPALGEGAPWASLRMGETALGTSGGDQQPGHILDPRRGEPARGVLQATVVAASAREADALSTTVFVLGAEEGLTFLEKRGAAGLVLLLEDGRRVVRTTPGFAAAYDLLVAADVELRE
jgi:thiamine biosynthesis lipoprotein ApbE